MYVNTFSQILHNSDNDHDRIDRLIMLTLVGTKRIHTRA